MPVLLTCKREIVNILLSERRKDMEYTLSVLESAFKLDWNEIKPFLKWRFLNDPIDPMNDTTLLGLFKPCKKFLTLCLFELVTNGRPEVRDEELQKKNVFDLLQGLEREWKVFRDQFDVELENDFASMSKEIMSHVSDVQNGRLTIFWEEFKAYLQSISSQQYEVTVHNFYDLTIFANNYRITPQMLKCLDFIYDNYLTMREEHIYTFVKLATIIEHKQFQEHIKEFIRSKRNKENPLQWLQDNNEQIKGLDKTSKSFILDVFMAK